MGARRGGGPKISRFFPLSRHKIRSFLPSLGVFSWNFGGVLKRRVPTPLTQHTTHNTQHTTHHTPHTTHHTTHNTQHTTHNTQHTTHNTTQHTTPHNKSKSVLAKVGHDRPLQRASTRTFLEQCSPHQRHGHFSGVSLRTGGPSGM